MTDGQPKPGGTEPGGGPPPGADLPAEAFARRPVLPGMEAPRPLVSVGWRALQRGAAGRDAERRAFQAHMDGWADALVRVAEEVHGLGRLLADPRWSEPGAWLAEARRNLETRHGRLLRLLHQAGVQVVAPGGADYAGELTEYLRNVAQVPTPGLTHPRVREVISPALLLDGHLVRAGAAVIAVPAEGSAMPADPEPASESSVRDALGSGKPQPNSNP